jgi:hypothetical protein
MVDIVISSGHAAKVPGASGYLDEVRCILAGELL